MATRRTNRNESPFRRLLRRLLWVGGTIAVLLFLVQGGEYGTRDLMNQRARYARALADVKQLEHEVDSLRAEYKSVTTDPVRLERIAREEYGMVKGDKEMLYWFGKAADSTSR